MKTQIKCKGQYILTAHDALGNHLWTEVIDNIVTTAGLNYAVGVALAAASQLTSWFVMLLSSSPTLAAGDTASSHAGWTEVTGYSESTRQAWTPGSVSGGSVNNSASKAVFSINASVTVGGVALISNSTKSGTTGTLYSEVALPADRTLASGDTLTVQYTFTQADDGV